MHTPATQPTPLRRLLDTTQQTLTINYAQVRDAVERVFQCTPPKIVNGLWAVFQDHARQAAEQQAAQHAAEQAARERVARQAMLEAAFGTDTQAVSPIAPDNRLRALIDKMEIALGDDPQAAKPNPIDVQLLATLDAQETNEHMARRLAASLQIKRTPAGEETLAQIEARITELRHRATELRALGARA